MFKYTIKDRLELNKLLNGERDGFWEHREYNGDMFYTQYIYGVEVGISYTVKDNGLISYKSKRNLNGYLMYTVRFDKNRILYSDDEFSRIHIEELL